MLDVNANNRYCYYWDLGSIRPLWVVMVPSGAQPLRQYNLSLKIWLLHLQRALLCIADHQSSHLKWRERFLRAYLLGFLPVSPGTAQAG